MEYDLTPALCAWLDDHMVVQVLDFAGGQPQYSQGDILRAKLQVLARTKMLDFARIQQAKAAEAGVEVPAEAVLDYQAAKDKLLGVNQQLRVAVGPLVKLVVEENPAQLAKLRAEGKFTMARLGAQDVPEAERVTPEHVRALRDLARLYFDMGQYFAAAEWLKVFRELTSDPEQSYWALWGQLAAGICCMDSADMIADVQSLKHQIDARNDTGKADQATSLHHRTWLAHWAIFLYQNDAGREAFIRMFLGVGPNDAKPSYGGGGSDYRMSNAVQLRAPYLLRYLCAAVVVQERFNLHRDLVRMLADTPEYRDPMTDFIRALYGDHDLEAAQAALKGIFKLSATDFVLSWDAEKLRANCRRLLFQAVCQVRSTVPLAQLADHLGIDEAQQRAEWEQRVRERQMRRQARAEESEEKAEKANEADKENQEASAESGNDSSKDAKEAKEAHADADDQEEEFVLRDTQALLVELIRNSRVNARIDAVAGRLLVVGGAQSVYQTLVYRTRPLIERGGVLTSHVERRLNDILHRD